MLLAVPFVRSYVPPSTFFSFFRHFEFSHFRAYKLHITYKHQLFFFLPSFTHFIFFVLLPFFLSSFSPFPLLSSPYLVTFFFILISILISGFSFYHPLRSFLFVHTFLKWKAKQRINKLRSRMKKKKHEKKKKRKRRTFKSVLTAKHFYSLETKLINFN